MARGGGRRVWQWIALALGALFLIVGLLGGIVVSSGGDSAPNTLVAPPSTSANTTSPPATTPVSERDREACEEKAREAEITYQPQKEMVVGVTETVEVVATVGSAAPPSSLPGDEPSTQQDAVLACSVEAELTGLDFDIAPSGPQERSFVDEDQLTWSWNVQPRHSGSGLPLLLTVRGFAKGASDVPGARELARGPDPISVSISVESEPRSFTERAADMWWGFWGSPLWTGIAGVLAVLAFFGVRGREPNRREKPKPLPPPPLPPPAPPRP